MRGRPGSGERATWRDLVWIPLYFDEDVYVLRQPYALRPRADSYLLASDIGFTPAR
jgi:hypothetical protein